MNVEPMYLTIFLIAGGIIFLVLFFHYVPFFLWLSAKVSGVNISLVQLFLMRIRNVPPYIIVPGMIEAHKAGLSNITRDELEAHYLAGGHVERVVMHWYLHRRPISNFHSKWLLQLILQVAMSSKPCRCRLILKLSTHHP